MSVQPIADFHVQNALDWKRLIDELFPLTIPGRAIWTDHEEIIRVLNHIGSVASSNYTFFAGGGGHDLAGARVGNEPGTIELLVPGAVAARVCKPTYLLFESLPGNDYQWAYFRLETAELTPTGVGHVSAYYHGREERLTEMRPGQYDSLDKWEYRSEREEQLPSTARPVTRLLNGSIVTFQKSGDYNQHARGAASGLHAQYPPNEFKDLINQARVQGLHLLN